MTSLDKDSILATGPPLVDQKKKFPWDIDCVLIIQRLLLHAPLLLLSTLDLLVQTHSMKRCIKTCTISENTSDATWIYPETLGKTWQNCCLFYFV